MPMSLDEINSKVEGKYPLTELQLRFCILYLEKKNGMKAVRDAGYTHSTPGAQSSAAYRLLRQEKIKRALDILSNSGA